MYISPIISLIYITIVPSQGRWSMEAAAGAADGFGKSPSSGFISWTAEGEATAPWMDLWWVLVAPFIHRWIIIFPYFPYLKISKVPFVGTKTACSDRIGAGFSIKTEVI